MEVCEADIRCLDAHAHFGNFVFDRTAEAIRHYKAGVRIGELSFGQNLEGFSRGVTSTTGRFSAACTGTAYVGGVRVGSKRPNVYSIACCGSTRLTIKACGA